MLPRDRGNHFPYLFHHTDPRGLVWDLSLNGRVSEYMVCIDVSRASGPLATQCGGLRLADLGTVGYRTPRVLSTPPPHPQLLLPIWHTLTCQMEDAR